MSLGLRTFRVLVRQLARANDPRKALIALMNATDRKRYATLVAEQPNGSDKLQAWYQAIADATDSLEAISQAIADGDGEEAQRLIALAHDSLTEHQTELKGQL